MARLPRYSLAGQPLHAIQRGNNRTDIFKRPEDYAFFRECLLDCVKRYPCSIHAYVFMTNHIHLLVSAGEENGLPKLFQSLGRKYVQYFNFNYQRTGTLWEGRYRATVIDAESYLLICMRYIELNPVRANMVSHPGEYPYSSYRANALGGPDHLVTPHSVYRRLAQTQDARRSAYRQLFRAQISKPDLSAIRESTNKGWVLGSNRFKSKIETLCSRRTAPLPKGRPRESSKHETSE